MQVSGCHGRARRHEGFPQRLPFQPQRGGTVSGVDASRRCLAPPVDPRPYAKELHDQEYRHAAEWHVGGGAFALVVKVHDRNNTPFAVKIMNRPNFERRGIGEQLEREVRLLMALKHPNIVRMERHWEVGDNVFLALEYCSRGDMQQVLASTEGGRLSEATTAYYMKQLLDALAYVHAYGALHRDVKPENLLVTSDWLLKLTDFGWAAEMSLSRKSLSGTFTYMAPEILRGDCQDEKVDAWSTGSVMFEFLSGRPLLQTFLGAGATGISHQNPQQSTAMRQQMLLREIGDLVLDVSGLPISEPCAGVLLGLLERRPSARLSCAGALALPWLQGGATAKRAERAGPTSARATQEAHVPTPEKPRAFLARNAYSPPADVAKVERAGSTLSTSAGSPDIPSPRVVRKLDYDASRSTLYDEDAGTPLAPGIRSPALPARLVCGYPQGYQGYPYQAKGYRSGVLGHTQVSRPVDGRARLGASCRVLDSGARMDARKIDASRVLDASRYESRAQTRLQRLACPPPSAGYRRMSDQRGVLHPLSRTFAAIR